MMKKYIVEALGTGTLALVVGLSLRSPFPVSTPLLAGLVLALFVYSIGHISGTHINPAVTLGAWSIGKIKTSDAVRYIVAQFVGAIVALTIIVQTGGLARLLVTNSIPVFFAELLGTFFFTFGIASVVYEKASSEVSGLVIGGSLILGIAVSGLLGANGVLNPAVAFGIGSFNLAYILGPIAGSVCGMQTYKRLMN